MLVQHLSEVTEKNHQNSHVRPRNFEYRVHVITIRTLHTQDERKSRTLGLFDFEKYIFRESKDNFFANKMQLQI